MEALGSLVQRGEMDIEIVEANWTAPILIGWQNLRTYATEHRELTGEQGWLEWVQWLAETIERRRTKEPKAPAYVRFRDWSA